MINQNIYLKKCLDQFKNIREPLFIIGWSCSNNDKHLINILNNNNYIKTIFISYYNSDTKNKFIKSFPSKNLVFFHFNILPFSKK